MKVKSILIYPIKGMQGVSLANSKSLERGFSDDRRYMLIDDSGTFISQRSHPLLTKISPFIIGDEIVVKTSESQFSFLKSLVSEELVVAKLFDKEVEGYKVSSEVDSWFSEILQENVRLIKMTNRNVRIKELIKGPGSTEVSFADGYPYLILGTASMDFLNSLLESPINMDRFRPNIVIETVVPHEEDSWDTFSIGKAKFQVIKPCARCPVVTINQQTGKKGKEPLKTLSSYRKNGNNVFFGANTICTQNGEIELADEVILG